MIKPKLKKCKKCGHKQASRGGLRCCVCYAFFNDKDRNVFNAKNKLYQKEYNAKRKLYNNK